MDIVSYILAKKGGSSGYGGYGLPPVTSNDNGKLMKVVNGEWIPSYLWAIAGYAVAGSDAIYGESEQTEPNQDIAPVQGANVMRVTIGFNDNNDTFQSDKTYDEIIQFYQDHDDAFVYAVRTSGDFGQDEYTESFFYLPQHTAHLPNSEEGQIEFRTVLDNSIEEFFTIYSDGLVERDEQPLGTGTNNEA